jgi:ornithine--oxo-acid transaminase
VFPQYAKYVCEYFGYEMVLPMNTGAEAVETSLKLARKWGYQKKGIEHDKALIVACTDNFHGRTLAVISMSTDEGSRGGFGPYLPGVGPLCPSTNREMRYGNIEDLEAVFKAHATQMAGFLVEPIQGEAGVIVPDDAFLVRAHELCKQHNVLFIADEIQTGIGRTGKMLAMDHIGKRPDVVLLGKALSGGLYPVSAVLADRSVMECFRPGDHGSTYGGNPLGCAVALTALQVVKDEGLVENARVQGDRLMAGLKSLTTPFIKQVRGRGLLCALEVDHSTGAGKTAWQLCLILKKHGLLAKPTHDTIIRLAPPLIITSEQTDQALDILRRSIAEFEQTELNQLKAMEEAAEHFME